MTGYADFLLLAVLALDLYVVYSSRLAACVRASALPRGGAGAPAVCTTWKRPRPI